MTKKEIAHLRLINHHIAANSFDRPVEVVQWMGAIQAQFYRQALWAVGLRMKSARIADIEQAIAGREIVQTWPMRGTLHFVPAENVKWMLSLLSPRRLAADKTRQKQLEISDKILEQSRYLFQKALTGGKRVTRSGMMKLLEVGGINPKGQRGYHILWNFALEGLICFGPMQDKEQTFVLLDEWVPFSRTLFRDEALAELAGIYFKGHGPATVYDFANWTGLTLTDARAGLESVKLNLVSEKNNEIEFWQSKNTSGKAADTTVTYMLPGFDEYLIGYKNRSDVLAKENAFKVAPGGNGMFLPMIVVDGQVVGTWKSTIRKNSVEILLNPFPGINISKESITGSTKRFCDFFGLALKSIAVN